MASGEIITTKELFGVAEPEIITTEELFGSPDTISTNELFSDQQVAEADSRADQLLAQLKGRVPSFQPGLAAEARGILPQGSTSIPNLAIMGEKRKQEELARRGAFIGLIREGFSPEQINLTLKTQNAIEAKEGIRVGKMIGGTIAGIAAGQLIPGPADELMITRALIASLGAGAGGAAGEALQTAAEEKRLINRRETLGAFASEAAFEGLSRGGVLGLKFFAAPFIKKTVPEAAALLDDYGKFAGQFSPTELDKRLSLQIGESIARGSLGAEPLFRGFEETQANTAVAFARSIMDDMVSYSDDVIRNTISKSAAEATPKTLEAIGKEFGEGITRPGGRVFKQMDDLFDPLYKQLDELTEGTGVSTASLKRFRKKVIADNQRLIAQAKRTGKELPLLSPAGAVTLKDIDNLPLAVSHADYRAFRTKILEEGRKLNRDVDVSKGMVRKVASITRDELFNPDSVAGASPEAKRLHKNITRLYAATEDALERTFSPQLAKRLVKNPDDVVKAVIPNGNPNAVRELRRALTTPIGGLPDAEGTILWENLRRTWLSNAIDEASKEGVINPRRYDNIIRKLGPETFNELFPEPSIAKNVRKIQSLFKSVGKKPPGSSALISRGLQGAGVLKMYTSEKKGDYVGFAIGGAMAFGPYALAKMMTSPGGIKLLTSGLKIKPGSSAIVPFMARSVKLLTDIDQEQRDRQIRQLKLREIELKARKASASLERRGIKPFLPPPTFRTPQQPGGGFIPR